LAYELPDKKSHLVAELLSKTEPEFEWDNTNNLRFYYQYDFLPAGVITRFIVRIHQDLENKSNGTGLCWREGAVLKRDDARAFVKVRPLERKIEIKITGIKKRQLLEDIRHQFDYINRSIKKVKITKEIPCICSKDCLHRFNYEQLLVAESTGKENVDCPVSWKEVPLSLMLNGYKKKEKRMKEIEEILKEKVYIMNYVNQSQNVNQVNTQKQDIKIDIDIKNELPALQSDFENLKYLLTKANPNLEKNLKDIGDSLDEVSANTEKEKLNKPFNKLRRFLEKLADEKSDFHKVISGTEKGIELAQKVAKAYNKFAQILALPLVPDLILGK